MRTIDEHKVNPANDVLNVLVMDEPSAGGANHRYDIAWSDKDAMLRQAVIEFQNGPIAEAGVNGLTHEVLLAIIADRLRAFQAGPYACLENHEALECVMFALSHLKRRTEKRLARGVEGTHTV